MLKILKDKSTLYSALKNALWVIAGSIVLAFGFAVFIFPFYLVTGGVSGFAVAIVNLLPFNIELDILVAILTWSLFFVGLIFLGRAFALKTLLSSIVYPIALSAWMRLISLEGVSEILDLAAGYDPADPDYALPLICAVFGGALIGAGCALTFRGGGSTGGIDIIALIMAKYIKGVKSSVAVFACDATVVIIGLFVKKDIIMCLLGVASALVGAIIIDKVLLGERKSFIAHIISEKYEEINHEILTSLERGSTIITAKGGYTGESRPMLMVSFTKSQYASFMAIISRIDKNAFVTIHLAHGIEGEGFTKNDTESKKSNKTNPKEEEKK
jgi:uncharacterized membrane-anchored protein YitT (DUF2179 family)